MPIVDGSSIKNFDPLPADTYDCELEKYENKQAKDGESENINLTFNVTSGEYEGRKLFTTQNLKPQSLWSLKAVCVALGADPEAFAGEFDTDEILEDLLGNPCRVVASLNTEGDFVGRQKVDKVLAPNYVMR